MFFSSIRVTGLRLDDVSGLRLDDVSGLRLDDVSGLRLDDVSGLRLDDISGFDFSGPVSSSKRFSPSTIKSGIFFFSFSKSSFKVNVTREI
jgi:hypothetical protein